VCACGGGCLVGFTSPGVAWPPPASQVRMLCSSVSPTPSANSLDLAGASRCPLESTLARVLVPPRSSGGSDGRSGDLPSSVCATSPAAGVAKACWWCSGHRGAARSSDDVWRLDLAWAWSSQADPRGWFSIWRVCCQGFSIMVGPRRKPRNGIDHC
jgi:hypothetical protein